MSAHLIFLDTLAKIAVRTRYRQLLFREVVVDETSCSMVSSQGCTLIESASCSFGV